MGPIDRPSQFVQHPPRLNKPCVLCTRTQKSEDDVIHGGPKDGAFALDVKSPATVTGMLSSEEVPSNLD